jgi:hypothetical protein
MKTLLPFIFCLLFSLANAQVRVTGKVIDMDGNPLEGASVYINNSSIGTTTSLQGYFDLSVEHGYYVLIVSYLGYETTSYNLNTLEVPQSIVFKLAEKPNRLNEVVIKKEDNMSRSKRAFFMKKFKDNFLGTTFLSTKTKIKNEYAIKFEYDDPTHTLDVYTIEPLVIENKGLGYKITYDLVHFQLDAVRVSYLGYSKFEDLEGSTRKERKWKEAREITYEGSLVHFLKSRVENDTLAPFVVDEIRMIPNPDRPSDKKIAEAELFVKKNGGLQRNPYVESATITQQLKVANDILEKAKLTKFVNITLRKDLPLDEYFTKEEDGYYLFSENPLRVKYLNEYPESRYPGEKSGQRYQESHMTFYNQEAMVYPIGIFKDPLEVFLLGYWAYEKVADRLPIDYKPKTTANK